MTGHDSTRSPLLGIRPLWAIAGMAILLTITAAQLWASRTLVTHLEWSVAAYVVFVVVSVLAVQPAPDPYPLRRAALMAAALGAASALVTANYATDDPGLASWPGGASGTVFVILAMRGRVDVAWWGLVLTNAPTFVWSAAVHHDIVPALVLAAPNLALVAGAHLYRLSVGRALTTAAELERRHLSEEADARARETRVRVRQRAHQRVVELAEPVLRRALTDPSDPDLPSAAMYAEAVLRDAVHAPMFATEPLVDVVWAVRQRGNRVDVRDDSQIASDPSLAEQVGHALEQRLRDVSGGHVVVRLWDVEDEVRLSVRVRDHSLAVYRRAGDNLEELAEL